MEIKQFKAGEIIYQEGEETVAAYRVLAGRVSLSKQFDGTSQVLAMINEGEIFGAMALVLDQPHPATAKALTQSSIEVITETEFNELILKDPEKLLPYLSHLFTWIQHLVETMGEEKALMKVASPSQFLPTMQSTSPTIVSVSTEGKRWLLHLAADNELTKVRSPQPEVTIETFPFRIGRKEMTGEKKHKHGLLPNLFRENHFLIDDRVPFQVSRSHCSIEREGNRFFVCDRESRTGTSLNGQRLGHETGRFRAELQTGQNRLVLGTEDSEICYNLTLEIAGDPKTAKELDQLKSAIDRAIADGQLSHTEMEQIKALVYADNKVTAEEASLIMGLMEKVSSGEVQLV